jgi:hypothetical protein
MKSTKRLFSAKKLTILLLPLLLTLAACGNDLAEYKANAKTEIENYAVSSDYSTANWTIVFGYIADSKTAIEEAETKPQVDAAVIAAKNTINTVLTKEQEMADFILTVTVVSETVQYGQNFEITAVFKNQSGETVEISHSSDWIRPSIANWHGLNDIHRTVIEKEEELNRKWNIGNELPKGQHTLFVTATFEVLQIVEGAIISSQSFIVESNKIIILVI